MQGGNAVLSQRRDVAQGQERGRRCVILSVSEESRFSATLRVQKTRFLVPRNDTLASRSHGNESRGGLALAQGQMANLGVGRDVESEVGEQQCHPAFRGAELDEKPFFAEHHVL